MIRCSPGDVHRDSRGVIRDLLVKQKIDSVTRIFTVKDAIRGNHYHKKTNQWTYVVYGRLYVVTEQPLPPSANRVRETDELSEGQLMLSPQAESHAWKALEDTLVLVFTSGPRSGENYESDTIRLSIADRLIV